jgi:putative transposase
MGYIKIWVHLVWTTKNREPILTKDIRKQILDHLLKNAIDKGIYIDFINGYFEHVHCLVSLGSGQNIDKIVMLLKGESSYWINKNKLIRQKFELQDEYRV